MARLRSSSSGSLFGRVVLAALGLMFIAASLLAQTDRATIEGIVADSSGAAITGAEVKIVRVQTNDLISLKTNEQGRFYAPNLPLGTYRVSVDSIESVTMSSISFNRMSSSSAGNPSSSGD